MLPELPLNAWQTSKTTLHLFTQVVGKIRLALHPKLNHWWHVPLYVSTRGLTTGSIPISGPGGRLIELEFDLLDHNLNVRSSDGRHKAISLYDGLSVAVFYQAVLASLKQLGVKVSIVAEPYDPARAGSEIPFAEDTHNASYDTLYVNRFWRILCWVQGVFIEFQGRYCGKSSPVHLFWHSLDLTYTRFSGRRVQNEDARPMEREAYSHEVISFGFWPGDSSVTAPAFYSYTAPEPAGLADAPLAPTDAFWKVSEDSSMALLMYDDLRQLPNPKQALLDFLESAYLAGATKAGWDMAALRNEHVGFITPPARS
jgi:hypothetical protein